MFALIGWIYRLFFGIIPLNCAVIIAGYREIDTISIFRFLAYLQTNVTLGPVYFVANSIAAEAAFRRSGRGILLIGTNADGEWSAYQQALDEACLHNATTNGVLILNDTVLTHRNFSCVRYLCWLQALRRNAGRNVLLAQMNGDPNWDLTIFNLPVSRWASTYLMYIGVDLLAALGNQVILRKPEIDEWMAQATVERFFPVWINLGLRDHLHLWLFGGGWYGSQPLSDENLARFKFKAKAIFHEKVLSSQSISSGNLIAVMPEGGWACRANRKLDQMVRARGVARRLVEAGFLR